MDPYQSIQIWQLSFYWEFSSLRQNYVRKHNSYHWRLVLPQLFLSVASWSISKLIYVVRCLKLCVLGGDRWWSRSHGGNTNSEARW